MADRPIIFSAPMVRALLEGRKTQTRRLCAWANNPQSPPLTYIVACDEPGWFDGDGVQFRVPYAHGNRLWVKEAHARDGNPGNVLVWYREGHAEARARGPRVDVRWRPSIHMPRWASRLTLTVTEVRVQRLQAISEADALAEGMTFPHGMQWGSDPRDAFSGLWGILHTKSGMRWKDDPWVVAISFDVAHCNIDGVQAHG